MTKLRYSMKEAAEQLSISPRKLEDLVADKALTVHQDAASGPRYISHASLLAYIEWREGCVVVGRFARRAG